MGFIFGIQEQEQNDHGCILMKLRTGQCQKVNYRVIISYVQIPSRIILEITINIAIKHKIDGFFLKIDANPTVTASKSIMHKMFLNNTACSIYKISRYIGASETAVTRKYPATPNTPKVIVREY